MPPTSDERGQQDRITGSAAHIHYEDEPDACTVLCAVPCPTTTPERHLLGEFPMTCYRCHVEADS